MPTAELKAESVICPPPAAFEWSWVALVKLPIVGVVKVLLAKVSAPARVASVPVVGKVTFVVAVSVSVKA
ncbi:MAG: hypothetical protein Unbinned7913contig1002_34 [Prokaryotic dsDNA virus sp.]|nr:MAG: hypothetical protein Unbinned7913contig1002_34 [Prokaryotic dsDNA virus sp.]